MLKSKPFKACLLIAAIVFCLSLNGVSAETCKDCPPNLSTIPKTAKYQPGWLPEWDTVNSAKQFLSGEDPVSVAVLGGQGPYQWEVNEGFSLACTQSCPAGNTLSSQGTECFARITVTDSTGRKTKSPWIVRRPGGWASSPCYRWKMTGCYANYRCGWPGVMLDLGDHLVEWKCCSQGNAPTSLTGTCGEFQYGVTAADCNCNSTGLFNLYITKWVCN